jgi:hypothetical protein
MGVSSLIIAGLQGCCYGKTTAACGLFRFASWSHSAVGVIVDLSR